MLRKSDFKLVGKTEGIKEIEIDMIIHELYTVCKHALITKLEAIGGNGDGNESYYLYKNFNAEFIGIRATLSILDIDVYYKGKKIYTTYPVAQSFIESMEQEVAK
ncbi:hypothetical protein [Salipaludibacillus sp. CF4.18]|uniref:hypothetical protein n=1 Tax=Salipaludibacillus sp. CF4.18 TaxID=3373081 RepID=UPI003EE7F3E1